MKLRSYDVYENKMIPKKFTCDGEDISPHLEWDNVPADTKSFAIIVDDPDAPNGTWIHWLVCDIPKDARELLQNGRIPSAKEITNDFGKKEYGGPCPPSGAHRYYFKLYALDIEELPNPTKNNFEKLVKEHAIDQAQIMAKYARS